MIKQLLPFFFLCACSILSFAQTIAEIQGTTDDSPYKDQQVSTTGIVTAVHSLGYFLQDGTALRSGIYVYDQNNSPAIGDQISLTATVAEYFNLTELTTVTAYNVLSSGNSLPDPIELTTAQVNDEDYEGMLVKVVAANCTSTDIGFGEWQVNDGSGPIAIDDLIFAYSPTLNTLYTLTGPMTYTFSAYKIEPRSEADIEIATPLYFTQFPVEKDIQTNSLTISWSTNIAASTQISYGLTPALELGDLVLSGNEIDHEVTLDNLQAATVYYVKAISEFAGNTTPSAIQVMSTASNSSGKIKVYFNHTVDNSLATNELAVSTEAIADTIIRYINLAQQTLDITMYEVENQPIIDAINAAADRGVVVRYISDDEGNNSILDNLNSGIPLLKGNPGGIMHDKFLLIDRESVDGSWVMTGSMNHTVANLGWDFNNVICIQDQSLAKAYTLEFNEMWGSDGIQPDLANSKFGSDKTNNTPHRFVIGQRPVQLYFSPSDGTADQIKKVIDGAENEVAFAVLVFTENSLGTALKEAHDRNVDVKGIIDYVEFNGSEFDYLRNNGMAVVDYQNPDGSQWPLGPTLHHKYAIIDYISGTNPTLITGSHNWTASANSIHDENTLIIQDATLANIYYQEFAARFETLTSVKSTIPISTLNAYPNPTQDRLILEVAEQGLLQISNFNGQIMYRQVLPSGIQELSTSHWPSGIYYLRLGDYATKVVKL